jgi:hypothetical protein
MSATAGFACVACVTQDFINSALRAATATLVPAYSFSLPNSVSVGGTAVSVSGVLVAVAPQVTLQANADNLVSVDFGFAGELTLSGGGQSMFGLVVLSTTLSLGLVTNVTTNQNVQQITVGIDPTVASVTAVDVSVLAGPPISPLFNDSLTSPAVLEALTQAVRSLPPNLLQVTPQNISIPQQIVQTYQPPKGSLFFPNVLFQFQFTISRIVALPLNAAQPGPGVLAVAVDVSAPVATTGDPASLTDLTGPTGALGISYDNSGAEFVSGATNYNNIVVAVDSSWITSIINNVVSPQLANKFPTQLAPLNISFSGSSNCLQISIGDVMVALDSPLAGLLPTNVPLTGITLQIEATKWFGGVTTDSNGYYLGVEPSVTADATIQLVLLLIQFGSEQQPAPELGQITNDYWGPFVVGTSISVPWWVDALAIFLGGPAYIVGTWVASLLSPPIEAFYPTIIADANAQLGQGLASALASGQAGTMAQLVEQMPGTTAPDWFADVALGVSTDHFFAGAAVMLLPPGGRSSGTWESATIGGSLTVGDTLSITATLAMGATFTFSYTTQPGDTTAAMADGLLTELQTSDAPGAGLSAAVYGSVLSFYHDADETWSFTQNVSGAGTETITLINTSETATIGGTLTVGDTLSITAKPATGSTITFSYKTQAGDTPTTMAAGLLTALQASHASRLSGAVVNGNVLTFYYDADETTWSFTQKVSGAGTETITLSTSALQTEPYSPGSFPYLMVTDRPVVDPNTVPNDPAYPFPVRIDGSFNWPGIAWNQPVSGSPGPGGYANFDVHDLNPMGVVLKIPPGIFNPMDPTIFITWTATRTDTNAQILSQTLGLNQPGALSISIPHSSAAFQGVGSFQVNCTINQWLSSGGNTQIFNSGNVYLGVLDYLDRSHPYFAWAPSLRYIYPGIPYWNATPVKDKIAGNRWVKNTRASRIHRTDFWQSGRRCLVADTLHSMGVPKKGPFKGRQDPANAATIGDTADCGYLDHLPISLTAVQEDRNLARGVLCDYCFFGGPTKTALRNDFPTAPGGGLPQQ